MTPHEEMGPILREYRLQQNLTQSELAKWAGLNISTIGNVERGEENFTIDTLERILRVLQIDLSTFFKSLQNSKISPEDK